MGIGARLRYILKIKGIKHKDLAEYLGISASRLSNYMNDKREPDFNTLVRIAAYIKEPLDTFAKTMAGYPEVSASAAMVAESGSSYGSGSVALPLQELNAKRKSPSSKTITLGASFFGDLEEPRKNAAVFEATSRFPEYGIEEGDYLICASCKTSAPVNGDILLKNGRYPGFYRYHEVDKIRMLLDAVNVKNIVVKNQTDLYPYYKILFTMKKY